MVLQSCSIFPDLSGTYSVYLHKVFMPVFCVLSFGALGSAIESVVLGLFKKRGQEAQNGNPSQLLANSALIISYQKTRGSLCIFFTYMNKNLFCKFFGSILLTILYINCRVSNFTICSNLRIFNSVNKGSVWELYVVFLIHLIALF